MSVSSCLYLVCILWQFSMLRIIMESITQRQVRHHYKKIECLIYTGGRGVGLDEEEGVDVWMSVSLL